MMSMSMWNILNQVNARFERPRHEWLDNLSMRIIVGRMVHGVEEKRPAQPWLDLHYSSLSHVR